VIAEGLVTVLDGRDIAWDPVDFRGSLPTSRILPQLALGQYWTLSTMFEVTTGAATATATALDVDVLLLEEEVVLVLALFLVLSMTLEPTLYAPLGRVCLPLEQLM